MRPAVSPPTNAFPQSIRLDVLQLDSFFGMESRTTLYEETASHPPQPRFSLFFTLFFFSTFDFRQDGAGFFFRHSAIYHSYSTLSIIISISPTTTTTLASCITIISSKKRTPPHPTSRSRGSIHHYTLPSIAIAISIPIFCSIYPSPISLSLASNCALIPLVSCTHQSSLTSPLLFLPMVTSC